MVGVFCCMIENLTDGTEQGATNDGASAHMCGCVSIASIVFIR